MGGAIEPRRAEATAFPHRGARWLINVPGQWSGPGTTRGRGRLGPRHLRGARPFLAGGAYSNFMEDDETTRRRAAYGDDAAAAGRSRAVTTPTTCSRLNQNIAPRP